MKANLYSQILLAKVVKDIWLLDFLDRAQRRIACHFAPRKEK